jgi:tetratricopeptide (TPR) repeat protein
LRLGRVEESINAHVDAIAVFRRTKARRLEARAKTSLAGAVFVLSNFSDSIALGLEAIRIDLAIGGRFQIARTLSVIGQSYGRLGDVSRAEQYLTRARDAHQRYGDQNGRIDTLLGSAEVLIEKEDLDAAERMIVEAAAIGKVTGSAYDAVHEKILRALLARARGQPSSAVMYAFDARQVAEAQAYVAFHLYAMAIEALSRIEIGEEYTGALLATTALGTIETIEGSEFGLETRALCCEALHKVDSPNAARLSAQAKRYAEKVFAKVRDPELRNAFRARPVVKVLLDHGVSRARIDDRSV